MTLFPPKKEYNPTIYAYTLTDVPSKKGLLKVGYTTKDARKRIKEQIGTAGLDYELLFEAPAIRPDGSTFTDKDVHRVLKKMENVEWIEGEWFKCSLRDVKLAYDAVKERKEKVSARDWDFKMRPEQQEAVERTANYFKTFREESGRKAHFLWNAKMRFGKTFATYQLAKRMGFQKILVLTFKPAVESAWEEDLLRHKDFEGWQFYSRNSETSFENLDLSKPIVVFGSFQDFLQKKDGAIKPKNRWVHETEWDLVVFDEYHYGAWRRKSKDLFEKEDEEISGVKEVDKIATTVFEDGIEIAEETMPIRTNHYLYLSGTPFRAITEGEFIEEQIYNWTYTDEQRAKENWDENKGPNPYAVLPKMVMMTYKLPEDIQAIAEGGEFDEFDLNEFFKAERDRETGEARFVHEEYVQKWLDLLRGAYKDISLDNLKLQKLYSKNVTAYFPFQLPKLRANLMHTLWFLPSVASCEAMEKLLKERQNTFYHDFNVVVAAGSRAGQGVKALKPVFKAMGNPLQTKTITLTVGKLTTGVSVKPWSGIFMLRNLKSPETYFQAAFRVQTPWVIDNPDGKNPNKKEILKEVCYVFDFSPQRALRLVSDYATRLNPEESSPEKAVANFTQFLPVLAYDGSVLKEVDAKEILDIVISGTTATLLARRWESALLVNVDTETLKRLFNNEEAMNALMRIEGFRSLNKDLETIISRAEGIKEKKKKANEGELSEKEKRELSEEEKEFRSKRKEIQKKLIKFATRIPIFMYLTDYREESMKDIIRELEPELFKKVTGLTKEDFNLLLSLGLFNEGLMNEAVYKFKRYEDASLSYVGFTRHKESRIGGFSTSISREEYEKL